MSARDETPPPDLVDAIAVTLAEHKAKRTHGDIYGFRRTHCECGWAGSPWDGESSLDVGAHDPPWSGLQQSQAEHRDYHVASEVAAVALRWSASQVEQPTHSRLAALREEGG